MAYLPIVFEVGVLHRTPGNVATEAIPLAYNILPSPASVSWTDPPLEAITRAVGGGQVARGGRGTPSCRISGTFGQRERVIGTALGDGPTLQRRFEQEVVALGSAVTQEHLRDVVKRLLASAPLLAQRLAVRDATFERDDTVYLNVFDSTARRYFRIAGLHYSTSSSARGGGVAGLEQYQLSFQGVSPPIVSGETVDSVLAVVQEFLPLHQDAMAVIKSASADVLLSGIAEASALVLEDISDILDTIATQAESAGALLTGSISPRVTMTSFFGAAEEVAAQFKRIADVSTAYDAHTVSWSGGEVAWDAEDADITAIQQDEFLRTVSDAASLQLVAGRWAGMDNAEYKRFVEAGGELGGQSPIVAGTRQHVVGDVDTPESISRQYGVTWADILRINRKRTSDLLARGEKILIPTLAAWGDAFREGLPVLGSHATDQLGTDLELPVAIDTASGRLRTVSGSVCLAQGIRSRKSLVEAAILNAGQDLGIDQTSVLEEVAASIYARDPRAASVRVEVTSDESAICVNPEIVAIGE